MPCVGALLTVIFSLPDPEALSLLITASCPGGSSSNVAAYWVDGDMSLRLIFLMEMEPVYFQLFFKTSV